MALFSERYGYTEPSDVLIREQITPEIQNAICSCYDRLQVWFSESNVYQRHRIEFADLEKGIWTNFMNQREANFYNDFGVPRVVATKYLEDGENPWFKKLDLIEFTIKGIHTADEKYDNQKFLLSNLFVDTLNYEFKRLNFAYRVVNDEIVEITSEEEIKAIEGAIRNSEDNIKMHLSKALDLYAQRPVPDYNNSIKESITAVEAYCRERTREDTLGKAMKSLENSGVVIPTTLKEAFVKLYAYTNQPETGIRHALMDAEGKYMPQAEEALFMLVSCSAFINYLRKK